jgi:hypothetical protein
MKPIAQILATARSNNFIFDDEEEEVTSIPNISYRMHEFTVDSLAVVVDYSNAGKQPHEIYDALVNYTSLHNPSLDSLRTAELIRKYFKHKLLMRRLKSEHISDYMKEMEIALENAGSVRSDRLPILVKLPVFYKESVETDSLFKEHSSLTNDRGAYTSDEVWTFVKEISKYSKNEKSANFYFSNKNNNLLKVAVPFKDMGNSAWNYISSKKEIGIRSTLPKMRVRGYDFCLYSMTNSYELYEPR